jgi:glycosyl-4,4'-diaponeurosporenoate acyltransferase
VSGRLVVIDAAAWAGWSVVVGTIAARIPDASLARDSRLTALRSFERDGRCYERVAIRRWKDRVPEFGSFAGGRSKRILPGRDEVSLSRFAAETRRAEYVHWSIAAAAPAFALWNPSPLFGAMLVYAFFANAPFIAIQRYNRARIDRVVQLRGRRVAA